jgi:hypothetical protein
MAHLGFDSTTVEPSKGFDLIPAGEYTAEIIASEEKRTQSGNGSYVALTWQICDGEFAKRRIWVNLNLDNPNSEAVAIARGELSAICRAVGVLKPQESSELHMRRCRIKIKHKANKQTKELEARISNYDPITGAAPAPAVSPSTPGAAPVAGSNVPPWQRKA